MVLLLLAREQSEHNMTVDALGYYLIRCKK